MRTCKIITLIIFCAVSIADGANSYEQYIFTINAHFKDKTNNSLQTGFRLKDTTGIVTALHGVLGADTIGAYNESHQRFSDLKIDAVDIKHDLALLSSPMLTKLETIGLNTATNNTLKPRQLLDGWGHPQGINLRATPVYVNKVPMKDLLPLIPPDLREAFLTRESPAGDITIIDLDAALVPGFSGGPLLNDSHEVTGVIDGGLQKGSQVCWAIPINQINWQDADEMKVALDKIAQLPTEELFSFTPTSNKQPSSSTPRTYSENSLGACVLRAISEARSNFASLKTGSREGIGGGDYVWNSNLLPDGAVTSEVWNGLEDSDNCWSCDIYVSGDKRATTERFTPCKTELLQVLDNGWIHGSFTSSDGLPTIYFKNDADRHVSLSIIYRKNAYRLHVKVRKAE